MKNHPLQTLKSEDNFQPFLIFSDWNKKPWEACLASGNQRHRSFSNIFGHISCFLQWYKTFDLVLGIHHMQTSNLNLNEFFPNFAMFSDRRSVNHRCPGMGAMGLPWPSRGSLEITWPTVNRNGVSVRTTRNSFFKENRVFPFSKKSGQSHCLRSL